MNPFFPPASMLHLPGMVGNPFQRFPSDPRMVGLFDPTKVRAGFRVQAPVVNVPEGETG
jgi:hypothetical protein